MTRPLVLAISGLALASLAQASAKSRPKFAARADALAAQDDGRFVVLLLDNLITDPTLTRRTKEIARDGFARDSGGTVFSNVNVYEPAIDQVWQESGNYYLFGFEPAKRDDKRHTIEVRVKKPGLRVRARRSRG